MTVQPDGQQPDGRKLSGGAIASLTGAAWNAAQPGSDRWLVVHCIGRELARERSRSTRTSSGGRARRDRHTLEPGCF
jgi:hypothetical protein